MNLDGFWVGGGEGHSIFIFTAAWWHREMKEKLVCAGQDWGSLLLQDAMEVKPEVKHVIVLSLLCELIA